MTPRNGGADPDAVRGAGVVRCSITQVFEALARRRIMIRDHGEVDEGEVGAGAVLDVSGEPPAAV